MKGSAQSRPNYIRAWKRPSQIWFDRVVRVVFFKYVIFKSVSYSVKVEFVGARVCIVHFFDFFQKILQIFNVKHLWKLPLPPPRIVYVRRLCSDKLIKPFTYLRDILFLLISNYSVRQTRRTKLFRYYWQFKYNNLL